MKAYHGTTKGRARRIFDQGLLPMPPSQLVWFAEDRGYAMGRAHAQARRARDEPTVLACVLDIPEIRRRLGGKGVVHKKGIIAIDGPVTIDMMRAISSADFATEPEEVATWINALLDLAGDDRLSARHRGVQRLSLWINSQLASGSAKGLQFTALLDNARKWLPERFAGRKLEREVLCGHASIGFASVDLGPDAVTVSRQAEALELLDAAQAERRVSGLELLAEIDDPDLFDWCAICLEDRSLTVRIAALRTMVQCKAGVPAVVEPLADAEDRRVRAAAIAALAALTGSETPKWIEQGLRDPEACVRVTVAGYIRQLDPKKHRKLLELASHDPNPDISGRAHRRLLKKKS